jgi:hypothetical protein
MVVAVNNYYLIADFNHLGFNASITGFAYIIINEYLMTSASQKLTLGYCEVMNILGAILLYCFTRNSLI